MIEIGKNFLWELSRTKQAARTRKQTAQALATQAVQDIEQQAQKHAQRMDYLFRSSAEKTQAAYQRARQQLATMQARRASQGIGEESTSEQQRTVALQQGLTEARTQQALQQAAAQEVHSFAQKWQQFLASLAKYRKQSKHKNRLGSIGQAFINLFQ